METILEVKKKVTRKQAQFIGDEHRYSAYTGGVGAGKTNAGAKKAVKEATEKVCNGMVCAPTYRMLKDTTLPTLREEARFDIAQDIEVDLDQDYYDFIEDFKKTDMILVMENGSVIYLRSAEDPDKIRGLSLQWFWLDEAAYMEAYVWPVVIGRLRQHIEGFNNKGFVTGTPKGRNWIYEEWEEKHKGKDGYWLVRVSSRENPFLPEDYLKSLEENYTGKYYAQEIEGQFVAFEGLIYDIFNERNHIWPRDRELPAFLGYSYGFDYGYTNPTAIVCFGEYTDGNRKYDIQLDEVYKRQLTQEQVIDEVLKLFKNYAPGTVWVDPSEPDLIRVMQENNIDARAADNDVTTGIQREQAALEVINGKPSTYVLHNCVHTRAELASYCWKSKGKGTSQRFEDKPEKNNDHLMDARRYRRMGVGMAVKAPL